MTLSPPPNTPLPLEVRDLRFSYRSDKAPLTNSSADLSGLDFSVKAGECIAIMGRSGIGKTTLLRIVCGLITLDHRRGHWGRISIRGNLVMDVGCGLHVSPHDRNVGITFQKGLGLQEQRTVEDNVSYPLYVRGRQLEAKDRDDLTAMFALRFAESESDEDASRFWSTRVDRLSGGQRQRVALARCFALANRSLFLLDEPLDGQDNPLRQQLIVNMRRVIRRQETAGVVIVTHRMAEAFSLADRIVYLDTGADGGVRVVANGSPAELYDQPPSLAVAQFFGDPAMNIVPKELLPAQRVPKHFAPGVGAVHRGEAVALVRPHDLLLDDATTRCEIVVAGRRCDARRNAGDQLLYLVVGSSESNLFHVVAPRETRLKDEYCVGWNWDCLHLFSLSTGERLR